MNEHTTTMPDTAVIAGMVEIERLRRERARLREGHRLIRGFAERIRDNAGNPNFVRIKAGNIISWIDINAALQEAGDERTEIV